MSATAIIENRNDLLDKMAKKIYQKHTYKIKVTMESLLITIIEKNGDGGGGK